jgi:hypothetical protein
MFEALQRLSLARTMRMATRWLKIGTQMVQTLSYAKLTRPPLASIAGAFRSVMLIIR